MSFGSTTRGPELMEYALKSGPIKMIIKEIIPNDYYEGCYDLTLETQEGAKTVSFGSGEPEDFSLARDLNDAFEIKDMLLLAYNAGKNNEVIELISELETE